MKAKNKLPPCFGDLETVFPKSHHGLRETPEDCLACSFKTECLKNAMQGLDGLKVREEFLDRAYAAGKISFLERWSHKKGLKRRIKEKIKGAESRRKP